MIKNNFGARFGRTFHSLTVAALSLWLSFFVILLPSCGGGTDGSGVRSFSGQIVTEDASPIVGATVIIAETGDSTVSGSDGTFVLSAALPAGTTTATFVIEDPQTSVSGTLSNVGNAGDQVAVLIVVNRPAKTVQVVQQTPTPTPTSAPQATATPLPTALATLAPTATSVPATPTPTVTPTPAPVQSDQCRCDLDESSYLNANDFNTALNLYAVGNFDFDGNGLNNAADFGAFEALCLPLVNANERCFENL